MGRTGLLAALPAALLPGAFLSAEHTGLLLLLLAAAVIAAVLWEHRTDPWSPRERALGV